MILDHDDNVYVEGAKHYWRYHGKDTKQFASQVFTYCWVMGGIALACWGLAHFLVLLPHSNPQPHHYGHIPAANLGQTYSQYMKQHPLLNCDNGTPTCTPFTLNTTPPT